MNIVKKKIDEESLIKQMKDDSGKLIIEAGEKSDVAQMKSLVVKASSFKKTAGEKEKILVDYASSIEKMEEEIKQLKQMEHMIVDIRCYLAYFYRVEDIWGTDLFVEIS